MSALKLSMTVAIVCLVGAGVRADEKPDHAKLIVGKWVVSKGEEGTVPPGTIIEFTKDGKFKVGGKKDDMEVSFEGTYKVEGASFTFKLKIGEEERTQTIDITKISDKEMSTKNKEGKVVELKRSK